VRLEVAGEARAQLHFQDELHTAKRRRQRADH
jgi:hypothetical protein